MEREEEKEMGEVDDLIKRVEKLEKANAKLCMEINEADKTPRTPVRRFRCPHCKTSFHIKRCVDSQWRRYMPPAFCPGCGRPTKEEACGK